MMASKKKKAGKREPNGRLSRRKKDVASRFLDTLSLDERDAIGVGVAARIRLHGVKPEHSRDQMAGSYLGRLRMEQQITASQYEAGIAYLSDMEAYRIAIRAPRQPGAVDLNATHGNSVSVESVDFVQRAITKMDGPIDANGRRHGGIRGAIQEKQNDVRGIANLWAALSLIVLEDRPLPNLVGDLRYALNALAKHYGLEGRPVHERQGAAVELAA